MAALKLLTYREKPNTTNTVDYVTIECFVQKGIRVDGLIEPQILAILSDVEGKATDTTKRAKKIQDVKGW